MLNIITNFARLKKAQLYANAAYSVDVSSYSSFLMVVPAWGDTDHQKVAINYINL